LATENATIEVVSNATFPGPEQPLVAPTLCEAGAVVVCPASQPGWLFHVVPDEMPAVNQSLAGEAGLQVHAHFWEMLNVELNTCLPRPPEMSMVIIVRTTYWGLWQAPLTTVSQTRPAPA
jgi:hypothetical protein